VDPIIVTGMHRSGTTLISSAMERLGVFMGAARDSNGEALFFQGLNVWLLESAGARWDHPLPWLDAVDDQDVRRCYGDYLRLMLQSPRLCRYLGMPRYLRYRRVDKLRFPWGWKDPRNTFTLPLWLDAFEQKARVVHVRRHGVDVARSLVARHLQFRQRTIDIFDAARRFPLIYWLRPKSGDFVDSNRCTRMDGAFSLWLEYADQFARIKQSLTVPVLDVSYEEFLSDPVTQLQVLARFCDVRPEPSVLVSIRDGLRNERAFAHRQAPDDAEFAQVHAEELSRFGYT